MKKISAILKPMFFISISLLAFLGASLIIDHLTPEFEIPDLSEKLREFTQEKDKINILFFGNSRVYRHINPKTFDNRLLRQGNSFYSYNFGIPGLKGNEAVLLMEKIANLKPKNLKWVFIDFNPAIDFFMKDEITLRSIKMHNFKLLKLSVKTILRSPKPITKKIADVYRHLKSFFYHATNQSRTLELINLNFNTKKRKPPNPRITRGFFPTDNDKRVFERKKRFFSDLNISHYKTRLDNLKNKGPKIVQPPPHQRDIIEILVKKIKSMGAKPVFIIPPRVVTTTQMDISMGKYPLFVFNSPVEYPELFATEYRNDVAHLSRKGANIFTQLLAKEFIGFLKKETK